MAFSLQSQPDFPVFANPIFEAKSGAKKGELEVNWR